MLPIAPFVAYIEKNALFSSGDHILLAVSGGKDSVLMTQLFKLAGFRFSILHCNFNLRAEESQRDEAFVKLLAASLDVPFYTTSFDTKGYAETHRLSTQMAARELRYAWFEMMRKQLNAAYIALAHHRNDAIETLLLNLTRGTGISGLHGILPKRDYWIRPLLFLSRHEIDELVQKQAISYVDDSSNESDAYIRNRIRHHVVPVLKEINPGLEETFAQNMQRFAETEQVLQQSVAQVRSQISTRKGQDIYFKLDAIKALSPQKLLFFELLRPYQFTSAVVDEILASLDKQTGTAFYSSSHQAIINRESLMVSPLTEETGNQRVFIHPTDHLICLGAHEVQMKISTAVAFEAHPDKAFVDADKLIFPLVLRFKQDGDKFMPLGMRHFKKLSDFLIDRKIPLPDKAKIPLLLNGNGEIIWVAGLRQDNRYKVSVTTKKVAIFERLK